MTFPPANRTVAARVQALQDRHTAQNTHASSRSFSNTRRGPTGWIQPTSPVHQTTASRTREDHNKHDETRKHEYSPTSKPSPVIHPSNENQRAFRCPFPTSATGHLAPDRALHRYPEPSAYSQGMQQFGTSKQKSPSFENVVDETTELATARARLRAVPKHQVRFERTDMTGFTIDDLGTLLNDAIEEHTASQIQLASETSHEGTAEEKPEMPKLPTDDDINSVEDREESRHEVLDNAFREGSVEDDQDTAYPDSDGQSDTHWFKSADSQHGDEDASNFDADSAYQKRESVDQYLDLAPDAILETAPVSHSTWSRDQHKEAEVYRTPLLSTEVSQYSSRELSPVREKKAFFEQSVQSSVPARPVPTKPEPRKSPDEGKTLPQTVNLPRTTSGSFRKLFGRRTSSSNTQQVPPFLPLSPVHIPQEVQGRLPSAKQLSVQEAERAPRSDKAQHDTTTMNLKEELSHQEHQKRKPSLSWPPKLASLRRGTSTATAQLADATDTSSEKTQKIVASRPSIVRSKIKELLAASNGRDHVGNKKNFHHPGLVRQSSNREGVEEKQVNTHKLPSLQVPIHEQANMLEDSSTSSKSYATANPHAKMNAHAPSQVPRRNTNPNQSVVGTPRRGRSLRSRHSMTPRGSPCTVEQRFTLTPTKKSSRRSRSTVRVSVEVRSSPERENSSEEHVFVVRASLDPEDSADGDESSQ